MQITLILCENEIEEIFQCSLVARMDDADVAFSDNYFDVLPGEKVRITCSMPEGWTIDVIARLPIVYSLFDSVARPLVNRKMIPGGRMIARSTT